jgi:hypothetical protein
MHIKKPEGNRPLGRPRRRWVDIKMDLRDTGYPAWIGLICLMIGTSGALLQTGLGVHPTSYPMGTGGSFAGGKAVDA